MSTSFTEGTVLEGLSFEAKTQEAQGKNQATVLSCGGIFVPRREVPMETKRWKQIVNLPGSELSAKIFGFAPAPVNELEWVLGLEQLN